MRSMSARAKFLADLKRKAQSPGTSQRNKRSLPNPGADVSTVLHVGRWGSLMPSTSGEPSGQRTIILKKIDYSLKTEPQDEIKTGRWGSLMPSTSGEPSGQRTIILKKIDYSLKTEPQDEIKTASEPPSQPWLKVRSLSELMTREPAAARIDRAKRKRPSLPSNAASGVSTKPVQIRNGKVCADDNNLGRPSDSHVMLLRREHEGKNENEGPGFEEQTSTMQTPTLTSQLPVKDELTADGDKVDGFEMKIKQEPLQESDRFCGLPGDDDWAFFMSLLPHVRCIPFDRKLRCRNRILEVVDEFAFSNITKQNGN